MGRMHWIVATLGLGSLVLGSLALGSLAAGGAALAGGGAGGETGMGFTFAPGQQGTSPGKVFQAARASDPTIGLPQGKALPSEQEQRSNHGTPTWADFQQ
jgi:hypothetical protein